MSARDELNADLQKVNDPARTADVLIAEGWRKKPDYDELWDLIATLRDTYPRRTDDAPTNEIVTAILALMDRGQ